jgi:hypothetical protein
MPQALSSLFARQAPTFHMLHFESKKIIKMRHVGVGVGIPNSPAFYAALQLGNDTLGAGGYLLYIL